MNKHLLSIVGPTAIGKTHLSIALAKHFNSVIISADSRQFYKEMRIGTAVPSSEELSEVEHHFIQHKSITDDYSVGQFERDAIALLNVLFQTHDLVIMVGGSGLFVKAVTHGMDDFPEIDQQLRATLNKRFADEGLPALVEELRSNDPIAYESIALDNPRRVIRALEVCMQSGKPYSSFLRKKEINRNFKTISLALQADREILYDRINQRVDMMMENGLLNEVSSLKAHEHLNALNSVGYKELFQYLNKELSLDEAVENIKMNTRRFAKRQLTWFKKDDSVHWFDYKTDIHSIIELIESEIKKPH